MFYGLSASFSAPIKLILSPVFISSLGKLNVFLHKKDEPHPSGTPLIWCELSLWFLTPICAQERLESSHHFGECDFPLRLVSSASPQVLCWSFSSPPPGPQQSLLDEHGVPPSPGVNHGNVHNFKNHQAKTLCLKPSSTTTQNTSQMAHQLNIKPGVSISA